MRTPMVAVTALAIVLGLQCEASADDGAQDKAAKREALFSQLDTNGDGTISTDEVSEDNKLVKRLFKKGDADGDGALSRAEFLAAMKEGRGNRRGPGNRGGDQAGDRPGRPSPEMIVKRVMEADADGDGRISKEEAPERMARGFDRMDADGDGFITSEEITTAMKARQRPGSRGDKEGKKPAKRPGPPNAGGGRPSVEMIVKRIMQSDADGDGQLSKEEAPERMARGFDRMDADGDGFLTSEEITTAMKARPRPEGKGKKRAKKEGKESAKRPGPPNAEGGGPNVEMIVKRIMQSDTDGDGQLSREEAPERMAQFFDRVDIDADGVLVIEEVTESVKMMIKRTGQGRPEAGGRPNPEMFVKRFMEADQDGDGRISKDEAPERMQRIFDRLDANGDEYLDEQEIKSGAKAMAKRGKQGNAKRAGKKRPKGEKKPESDAE